MPVYHQDHPNQVEAAFDSIWSAQRLRPSQVVLVRDGPVSPAMANLLAGLAQFDYVTLVPLPKNRGLGAALNAGLAACQFEVVARQDADDISLPDRFALTVPLVASGQFDLIGTAMREFTLTASGSGQVAYGRVRAYPLSEAEIRIRAKMMNPFGHPSVVMRRSLVLSVGGYRDLFHLEDYDLWVRLLRAGAKVANLPEPLVDYRVSAAGLRRRGGLKTLSAELALQRRFLDSGFINRLEWFRNLAVRGSLELLPPQILRLALARALRRPAKLRADT
jgi:glycosyltransferase involved in cell wall biosynthesis